MPNGWGRIVIGTRLEKLIEPDFFCSWSYMLLKGLRKSDAILIARDRVAHIAANDIVRRFLKSDHDSLCFIDSDAAFGYKLLEELRTFEPGFEYDGVQAFYTRRGWPPEAIWFQIDALGNQYQSYVFDDDVTAEVAAVGLHFTLLRREVFERMRDQRPPEISEEDFNWFHYPRHGWRSEDAMFSADARAAGFRLGATTHIKTGHVSRIVTGWETYHDFLQQSGQMERIARYRENVRSIGEFLGEDPDLVAARAREGSDNVRRGFEICGEPSEPDELRAFYGDRVSGYFYDLIAWNFSIDYDRILEPLREISGKQVLVIGPGIGGEVDVLKDRNQVDVFELPGVMRNYLLWKYEPGLKEKTVRITGIPTLPDLAVRADGFEGYDLIVAVDMIEHIHPDELRSTLDAALSLLAPAGELYVRNTFDCLDTYPMHFDHREAWEKWIRDRGLTAEIVSPKTGAERLGRR